MNYLKTSQRTRAYPTEPVFWESALVIGVTLLAIVVAAMVLKDEVFSLSNYAKSDSVTVTVLDTDGQ